MKGRVGSFYGRGFASFRRIPVRTLLNPDGVGHTEKSVYTLSPDPGISNAFQP